MVWSSHPGYLPVLRPRTPAYARVRPRTPSRELVHELVELGDTLAGSLPYPAWERAVRLGEGHDADGRAEAVADLEGRAAIQGGSVLG